MGFKKYDGSTWQPISPKQLKGIPYTGTLPAILTDTKAGYLYKYEVYGNTEQIGTPTPENPIMPSGCGERTSNLFDESTIEVGGLSPSTGAEITNSARRRSGFILVEPSTDYGLSREITSSGSHFWVIAYDESKNIVTDATTFETFSGVLIKGNELTDSQWTFATTPTTRYIRWYVTYNNSYKNIMLNTGSSPLPYEPYGYKLPLTSAGQSVDIYLGESQTTRRIKKLVLTGSASDPVRKIGSNAPYAYYYSPTGMKGRARQACLCTHMPFSWSYSGETPAIIISSTLDQFFINFGKTTMDAQPSGNTVEGFKEFCAAQYAAGTPVTIWYVLAEPETAVVNEPLMKIGDYADTVDSTQTTARIPTVAGETTIDYGAAALLKVKANGGDISTYTGALPATLQTVAGYLASYKIWGNDGGVGAETENLAPFIDEWGDGYVNVRGFIAPADENMKERCSPHIAVEPGATYQLAYQTGSFPESSTSLPWTGVGWYNDDGFIERRAGYDRTTVTLVAPANATYAILSFRSYGENHNVMFIKASTSPASYIPYGYRLPIISNDATTDIYIGDTQLAKNEYVDSTGKIYRYVDGTLTPTDPPVSFPQIPTFAGETTIDYGIAALPHAAGLDGIFEYGNINGLAWKNSVSGENDITFDTAVTDTGAEYVLPAGASGQHTSKSGEYRTAFTWYCIAKCPTTCRDAGQYMISNWNNQGVEISSGWAAYSSAGTNHLIRSINNNDFNSAKTVTSYALIAVAGDVNGVASVYVNGVKMTDSWNFNPVSSSGAATVFLGKRASGQMSGTDIDYKFLALGTTKQTDAEIIANSQYLMTKYLGVGRPEKVELDVHGGAGSGLAPSEFDSIQEWVDIPTYTRVNGKWVANFETIIYGFHVDPSISDPANAVTYLLDAVGKTPATNSSSVVDYSDWADAFFMPKPCMLNYDGTVAYYLDPNDYTKKADGSPSDVANPLFPGNAMMEWPVIWWKFEAGEVEGEMSFYVSNRQVDSTYHCWCNIDAENHITDHFYTAIYNGTSATTYSDSATYAVDDLVTYSSAEYKCTTAVETPEAFDSTKWEKVSDVTRLRSLSGKALTAANGNGNTTGTVEVQRATANNTTATVEWYTDVFSDRQLINGLLTLVSKTLDSSAVYGRGLDLSGRATKEAYITGTLDDKGLFWGNPSAGTSAKKCFGMENWDGCVWHRTAGLIGSSSTGGYAYKLTYNTADGSIATSYNSTGSGYLVGATGDGTTIARPSDGYVKTMKVASATGIWLPGTVRGSVSTYYCDYYYNGSRYGLAGGRSSYGAYCGCWFLNLSTAFGTADWGVAASPSCKPLASRWKVFEGGDS